MAFSIFLCLLAYAALLTISRRDRVSLGLPFAYLSALLLIHVPGAFAHVVGTLEGDQFVEIGIRYTAIGAICFVVGVWLAHLGIPAGSWSKGARFQSQDERKFCRFCVVGGFIAGFVTSPLADIPSLGAIIDRSSVVWVLGVLLALRTAAVSRDFIRLAAWSITPVIFALFQLWTTGFLSYASTDTIVATSVLAIVARNSLRVVAGVAVIIVIGLNVFANYFENRNDIRGSIGRPVPFQQFVGSREMHFFDVDDSDDLSALDQRLNQNYFVGLSAVRIDFGATELLYGRSLLEGALALIPRALWPDKPVYGGSPGIVAQMTGLQLNPQTSFGVGNVMEFYINFGLPSLVVGFVVLGWLLGTLDVKAAQAERRGQYGKVFFFFLPAVALIQPNGSMVELMGGSAAALLAAFVWRGAWSRWSGRDVQVAPTAADYPPSHGLPRL